MTPTAHDVTAKALLGLPNDTQAVFQHFSVVATAANPTFATLTDHSLPLYTEHTSINTNSPSYVQHAPGPLKPSERPTFFSALPPKPSNVHHLPPAYLRLPVAQSHPSHFLPVLASFASVPHVHRP